MNQLVKEVLDFAHGEFVSRNLEVTSSFSPDLPQVNGDVVQLQQLVLNLVSNACEAMQAPQRRERRLSVTTLHAHDGRVLLVVSDTGPGVAQDRLERIFEPFFTTKENGLGLGLSICRRIAHAHGGTLVAEDRNGDGANLRLVLPPAETAARGPLTQRLASSPWRSP